MTQIAQSSKVLVGQIYRDFAGKEELIAAIVERDLSQILDDPELIEAIATGRTEQVNCWLRHFITRRLDQESRSILADIYSEASRNPRIATIMTAAHERLRKRLRSAAMVWAPAPEQEAPRERLTELIITLAGANLHREIIGLPTDGYAARMIIDLLEAEIAKLQGSGAPAFSMN
jgi:AcrR family transcriptional regulator